MTFGQLVDILGKNFQMEVADTDALQIALNSKHPILMDLKYMVAVDKKVITQNTSLNNESEIVLMPAFSGG